MSGFRLSWNADRQLADLVARVERESGSGRAERVRAEFLRNLRNLSEHPGMGHERPDLTSRSHRFWPVYSYLVVYRPESVPVEIVDILHGAHDPAELRDRIGEPVGDYVASGRSVVIALDAAERTYVEARIRHGEAESVAEVLRHALRRAIDPVAEDRRVYEAWREDARHRIEQASQASFVDDGRDGPTVFEEIRVKLEKRRQRGA